MLGIQEAFIILGLFALFVFEVVMFIDMLGNERYGVGAKVLWGAAMWVLPPFAAIYYFFAGRNPQSRNEPERTI